MKRYITLAHFTRFQKHERKNYVCSIDAVKKPVMINIQWILKPREIRFKEARHIDVEVIDKSRFATYIAQFDVGGLRQFERVDPIVLMRRK